MTLQNPVPGQIHRQVQGSLSADCRQHSVRTLPRDDGIEILNGQRLDVSAMREFRIGHDGGRVRIHQHHLVTFGAQGFARLGAGIVKLAGLADDDRAGSDDEDFLDVSSFGHERSRKVESSKSKV